MIQKINELRSWFFEKINKIDKCLTKPIKKKRERTHINKIRDERGEIRTEIHTIQRIVRKYYHMPTNSVFFLVPNWSSFQSL